jgi:hypothetical protein
MGYTYAFVSNVPLILHPSLPTLFPLDKLISLFTYLEIPLLTIVVRMSIHPCPWLVINCSPLAS